MVSVKVGIIGGTGLNKPDIIVNPVVTEVITPFGKPSSSLTSGLIEGVSCVLLARHGSEHSTAPSFINYRANVWALKESGCTHIIVSTACGSLREKIEVGDIVVLDQFIDRTYKRENTFYDNSENGLKGVCHAAMDKPFCPKLREIIIGCCLDLSLKYHPSGTMICIEGPRFSSKAESVLFRNWGAHVVNMTTVPEVCLAKELGIPYAAIALPTDYDCWYDHKTPVSTELALESFRVNCAKVLQVLISTVKKIGCEDWTEHLENMKSEARKAVV